MYGVPTRSYQYIMVDRRYDSGVWGEVMQMISNFPNWYAEVSGVIPVDKYLITPRPITITNFHIEDEYTIVHKVVDVYMDTYSHSVQTLGTSIHGHLFTFSTNPWNIDTWVFKLCAIK